MTALHLSLVLTRAHAALLCILSLRSAASVEARDQVPRHALGGYQDADPTDERVVQAANFAVAALASGAAPEGAYSFADALDEDREDLWGWLDDVDVSVVRAQQQVVAGMNYALSVAMVDKHDRDCRGAFEVTVWDRFGELSVTKWGEEIDCEGVLN